jgi:hypothetical protein
MWEPTTRAAATAINGRFSIVLGELQYDDPFSAIITYDPRLTQPWSRVDVEREIVDVTYHAFSQGELVPVALSNEGDVYTLHDVVDRAKIPGVGIGSPDADGRGQVWQITSFGSKLWVTGDNGQLWQGVANNWAQSALPVSDLDRLRMIENGANIVLAGQLNAMPPPDLNPTNPAENFLAKRALRRAKIINRPNKMLFFISSGDDWVPINAPDVGYVRALSSTPDGHILVAGVDDLLLMGTRDGLTLEPTPKRGLTFNSVVSWRDEVWLTSDRHLHKWGDGSLQDISLDLSPTVAKGRTSPFRLKPEADRLTYFDYRHDPQIWDGTNWKKITLPLSLRQREFDPTASL